MIGELLRVFVAELFCQRVQRVGVAVDGQRIRTQSGCRNLLVSLGEQGLEHLTRTAHQCSAVGGDLAQTACEGADVALQGRHAVVELTGAACQIACAALQLACTALQRRHTAVKLFGAVGQVACTLGKRRAAVL